MTMRTMRSEAGDVQVVWSPHWPWYDGPAWSVMTQDGTAVHAIFPAAFDDDVAFEWAGIAAHRAGQHLYETRHPPMADCDWCGRHHARSRKPREDQPNYCSERCRNEARRESKRRWAAHDDADPSIGGCLANTQLSFGPDDERILALAYG